MARANMKYYNFTFSTSRFPNQSIFSEKNKSLFIPHRKYISKQAKKEKSDANRSISDRIELFQPVLLYVSYCARPHCKKSFIRPASIAAHIK